MSRQLRETSFAWYADDDKIEFYSSDKAWVNRAKKWLEKYSSEIVCKLDEDGRIMLDIPRNIFTPPRISKKQQMSEERREMMAERMRNLRQMKKED